MTFRNKFFGSSRSWHFLNKGTDFQLQKKRKANRKRFMSMRLTKEFPLNSVFNAVFMQYQQNRWNFERRKWGPLFLFTTLHDPFSASSEEKPFEFCRDHSPSGRALWFCCCSAQWWSGEQSHPVTTANTGWVWANPHVCAAACKAACLLCWQVC